MPAIISQVEGLGKSWENCTRIRIKTPSPFKYSDRGDWWHTWGQAELWGWAICFWFINPQRQWRKNLQMGERTIKKQDAWGWVLVWGRAGVQEFRAAIFFLLKTYSAQLFKIYFGRKRKLEGLMYAQAKRMVRHYLSSQETVIYLGNALSVSVFSDAKSCTLIPATLNSKGDLCSLFLRKSSYSREVTIT